jgi:hypothetical protein
MVDEEVKSHFIALYGQFATEYALQQMGKDHLARYEQDRAQGRMNFDQIAAEEIQGTLSTDDVLQKLLPHTDSASHRESGAWIHVAPAIQGNIKTWFEAAGWTQPGEWPQIALSVLAFFKRCDADPSDLERACHEFVRLPYTTGLQTGILTPMLNALRPDDYMIVNSKSRKIINHFKKSKHKQRLTDYPAVNAAGHKLVAEMEAEMLQHTSVDARTTDLFDMFCHWLVAVKRWTPAHSLGEARVHVPAGETAVSIPEDDTTLSIQEDAPTRESHKIQAALAEIGYKMGFRIWIPRADRGKVLEQANSVSAGLLEALPLNYIHATLKIIEQIDVIWIKGHSIGRAFEVEHTTSVYSGLLRMADLLALQPDINIRLHIVAPDARREKVLYEIRRPIFSTLEKGPLHRRCSYISYSDVLQIRALEHLEYMSDSVLNAFEEFSEDE